MSGMTRRQLLAAAGLTAAGVPLTGSMARALEQLMPTPAVTTAVSLPTPLPGPSSGVLPPVQPLSLTWDATLSEDHFLASQVQADPAKETILPVRRSDGYTAVLVQSHDPSSGTTLSLVRPDPQSPSGYVSSLVIHDKGALSIFRDAVPGRDGSLVVASTTGAGMSTFSIDVNGTIVDEGAVLLPTDYQPASALRGYVASDGTASFTAVLEKSQDPSYAMLVVDPVSRVTTVTPLDTASLNGAQYAVKTASVRVETSSGAPRLFGALTALVGNRYPLQYVSGPMQVPLAPVTVTTPQGPVAAASILDDPIADPAPGRSELVVGLLWADAGGNAFAGACDRTGALASAPIPLLAPSGAGYELKAGPVTSATWFLDPSTGSVTCYLQAGSTLYLQHIDFARGSADLPVPLRTDVLGAYRPDRALSPVTTLVVATPSPQLVDQPVLATLARQTGTSTWQITPLSSSAPSNVEIDTYRTMLTVTDANGNPVAGIPLAVTPLLDLPVVAFQPGGAQNLPPGTATTLTTDTWGQVCLATPATTLYACPLSVQLGSAPPVTVNPDRELHTFLQGKGPITSYTTVQDALAGNAGSGKALPGLPAASVGAVATAITAAMAAGANPTDGTQPLTFTLSGLDRGAPTLATVGRQRLGADSSSWWDSVKDDLESVWHAIEHGVAKVATVVSRFDAEAKQWFVQLDIAIDNYVSTVIEYAIKDLRSACVAIHGIFQALGAAIRDAISFLRTLVSDLFKDAAAIADLIGDWFVFDPKNAATQKQGVGLAYSQIDPLGTTLKTDVNGLAKNIKALLGQIGSTAAATTVGGAKNTPQPTANKTTATGAHSNSKATFLLEKVRHTSTPAPTASPATHAGVDTITKGQTDPAAEKRATDNGSSAAVGATGSATDPHSLLTSLSVSAIADLVATIVGDAATIVDALIDDLLGLLKSALVDLSDLLQTNLDDLPVIGDLLSKLGDNKPLTINRLFCLVMGFTMAVVGDILFEGRKWLPTGVTTTRAVLRNPGQSLASGPAGSGEAFVIIGQLFVSIIATVVSTISGIKYETGKASTPLLDGLGFFSAVALNLLAFPFPTNQNGLVWGAVKVSPEAPLGENTPLFAWLTGFIPPVFDGTAATTTYREGFPRPDRFVDILLPLVDALFGSLLVAAAVWEAKATHQDPEAEAASLIGAIPWCTRIFRLAPVQSIPSYVSVAFDVAGPAALVVLSLIEL